MRKTGDQGRGISFLEFMELLPSTMRARISGNPTASSGRWGGYHKALPDCKMVLLPEWFPAVDIRALNGFKNVPADLDGMNIISARWSATPETDV